MRSGGVTNALADEFPEGHVLGVDLSESAVAFARQQYPRCEFLAASIDETLKLSRKFDVVHAREFYPFTRTSDLDFQRRYLRLLTDHLTENGLLLLSLVDGTKGLCQNVAALGLETVTMAHPAIEKWLPLTPARGLTVACYQILGKSQFRFYFPGRREL